MRRRRDAKDGRGAKDKDAEGHFQSHAMAELDDLRTKDLEMSLKKLSSNKPSRGTRVRPAGRHRAFEEHYDAKVASLLACGSDAAREIPLTAYLVNATEGYPNPGGNCVYTYPPAGTPGFGSSVCPRVRAIDWWSKDYYRRQ